MGRDGNKWLYVGAGIFFFILLYKKRRSIMAILNKYKLDGLNPDVSGRFAAFIADLEKAGYIVIITSVYRSMKEQALLKEQDSRNASPGTSAHNYGYAIDINISKDGKDYKKATTVKDWLSTGAKKIAAKHGLRWGGDGFSGYPDPVHFDATKPGDTTRWAASLKSQYGEDWLTAEANKVSWKTV